MPARYKLNQQSMVYPLVETLWRDTLKAAWHSSAEKRKTKLSNGQVATRKTNTRSRSSEGLLLIDTREKIRQLGSHELGWLGLNGGNKSLLLLNWTCSWLLNLLFYLTTAYLFFSYTYFLYIFLFYFYIINRWYQQVHISLSGPLTQPALPNKLWMN